MGRAVKVGGSGRGIYSYWAGHGWGGGIPLQIRAWWCIHRRGGRDADSGCQ